MTGWTLPLQMGVEVVAVAEPVSTETRAGLRKLDRMEPIQGKVEGSGPVFAFSHNTNASLRAVNDLLAAGVKVSFAKEGGAIYAEGNAASILQKDGVDAASLKEAADALPVNPYVGRDALEPFLQACRREGAGAFCLVKTSNSGSADVQDLTLSDGRPLWQAVAAMVAELGEELAGDCGLSSFGAVVGATHPRAVGEARRLMPQAVLLLPGVGAQGATPADVARAFTSGPASALVNASRSVIYAFRTVGAEWRQAAGAEAARLRREVWAVSGW